MASDKEIVSGDTATLQDLALMIQTLIAKLDRSFLQLEGGGGIYQSELTAVEDRCEQIDENIPDVKPLEQKKPINFVLNFANCLPTSPHNKKQNAARRFSPKNVRRKTKFTRCLIKRIKVKKRLASSTKDIGPTYEAKVYLNQDLGAKTTALWDKARQPCGKSITAAIWTYRGRIF